MHIDKSRVATTTIKLNTFAGTWIYERLKYWCVCVCVLELVFTIRIRMLATHFVCRDFRWLRPHHRWFRSHSPTSPTRSHSWFRREIDIFRSIDAGERVRLSFVVGQANCWNKSLPLPLIAREWTSERNADISAQCEKRKMEKFQFGPGLNSIYISRI